MNIFSYESKFNQTVMIFADLVILNILYVVFCLPVVTLGAANAGLYTGIRVLLDKEDDSSCAKAFFRGFKSGFKNITVFSVLMLALLAVFAWVFIQSLALALAGGSVLAAVLSGLAALFALMMQAMAGPFHASFGCTLGQLFRNVALVTLGNLPRALALAALAALPAVVFFLWPNVFIGGFIVLVAMYYSFAALMGHSLLKKPFQRLKDLFYAAQKKTEE